MADPRESKLPKWAQAELSRLRRDLSEEKRVNADLRGDIPDTNTYVLDYGRHNQPLPNNARVSFHLRQDDGRIRQSIQAYVEYGRLRIQGDNSLDIHPGSSNSFTLSFRER
ncbi:DUF7239 family protein [Streptomyces narbonensis]|uniref:DUF7239 family protein n=1 Tax=Streptomyces narbonensis TaxID=67333 RepID=UPI0033DB0270